MRVLYFLPIFFSGCSLGVKDGYHFVPAIPGETPICAKKGTSYCEYVESYPEYEYVSKDHLPNIEILWKIFTDSQTEKAPICNWS